MQFFCFNSLWILYPRAIYDVILNVDFCGCDDRYDRALVISDAKRIRRCTTMQSPWLPPEIISVVMILQICTFNVRSEFSGSNRQREHGPIVSGRYKTRHTIRTPDPVHYVGRMPGIRDWSRAWDTFNRQSLISDEAHQWSEESLLDFRSSRFRDTALLQVVSNRLDYNSARRPVPKWHRAHYISTTHHAGGEITPKHV